LTLRNPEKNSQGLEISVDGTEERTHGQNPIRRLPPSFHHAHGDKKKNGNEDNRNRPKRRCCSNRGDEQRSNESPFFRGFSEESCDPESDGRNSEGAHPVASLAIAAGLTRKARRRLETKLEKSRNRTNSTDRNRSEALVLAPRGYSFTRYRSRSLPFEMTIAMQLVSCVSTAGKELVAIRSDGTRRILYHADVRSGSTAFIVGVRVSALLFL